MDEFHEIKKDNESRKQYIMLVIASVFLLLIGIVGFFKYLMDEITLGHISVSQSIIIFLFEAIAVFIISKALKSFIERRTKEAEVSDS